MKPIIIRFAIALFSVAVGLLTFTNRPQTSFAAPQTPVTITRLYTGPDQLSHVEQVSLSFSPDKFEPDQAVPNSKSPTVRKLPLSPGTFILPKTKLARVTLFVLWAEPNGWLFSWISTNGLLSSRQTICFGRSLFR
jgi:hypothetical protein